MPVYDKGAAAYNRVGGGGNRVIQIGVSTRDMVKPLVDANIAADDGYGDDSAKCAAHIGLYLLILITAACGGSALLVGIFLGNMSTEWNPLRKHTASLLMLTVSLFASAYVNYFYAYKERKAAIFLTKKSFDEKWDAEKRELHKLEKPFAYAESQIQLWRAIEWTVMTPLIVAAAMSFVNIGLGNSKHTNIINGSDADFHTTIGTVVFYTTMIQVLYIIAQRVVQPVHTGEGKWGIRSNGGHVESLKTFVVILVLVAAAVLTGVFVYSIQNDYYTKIDDNVDVAHRHEVSKLLLYSVGIRMVVQLVWLLHGDCVKYAFKNEENDYEYFVAVSSSIIVCHEVVMFALDSIGRVGLLYMIMKDIPGGL